MEKLVNVRKKFLRIRKIARHPRVSRFTIHTFEKVSRFVYPPSTSPLRVCGRTALEEESSNISEIFPLLFIKCFISILSRARFCILISQPKERNIRFCKRMWSNAESSRKPLPFLHEICKAKTRTNIPRSPPSIIVIKHVLHILHFVARAINAN